MFTVSTPFDDVWFVFDTEAKAESFAETFITFLNQWQLYAAGPMSSQLSGNVSIRKSIDHDSDDQETWSDG